jgi:hypothetical protein
MPRPSATDSTDTSNDLQRRLITTTNSIPSTTNVPLIMNNHNTTGDLINSNLTLFPSADYRQQPTRLIQQHSLPTTLANNKTSNIHLISHNDSSNDRNISSSNSIPTARSSSIQLNNNLTMTTPLISPVQSACSTPNSRPLMEDKGIQCIDDEEISENSMEYDEQTTTSN